MITAKQSQQLQLMAELEALPANVLADLEDDLADHKRLLKKAQKVIPGAAELAEHARGIELLQKLLMSAIEAPQTGVRAKLVEVSKSFEIG